VNSLVAWKPTRPCVHDPDFCISELDSSEIREFANALIEAYPDDLDRFDFADELIQFAKYAQKHVRARDEKTGTSVELEVYIAASALGICEAFPNVNVAFRIHLCMLVTNCSGERSFSASKERNSYNNVR